MAVFYQKKWSLLMDACAQATGTPAVIYFMITVFLGSFCLLNLTVATVGQNYARVKKEAEAKMAKKVRLYDTICRLKYTSGRGGCEKSKDSGRKG